MMRVLRIIMIVAISATPLVAQTISTSTSGVVQSRPVPSKSPVDEKAVAERTERRLALADQLANEAAGLRLGENRAWVFAQTGALVWSSDQKASQSFFQRAINELTSVMTQAEMTSKSKLNERSFDLGNSLRYRQQILTSIANHNPEFALEALYRTRSASIQRALMQNDTTTPKGGSSMANSDRWIADGEISLEQNLMSLAARKNPELAIKLLQDAIKKGVSAQTLNLLRDLYLKDPAAANALADDVMSRVMSSSFSSDQRESGYVSAAFSILNDAMRERKPGAKELKFDDAQIRSLANKLINFVLSQNAPNLLGQYRQILPIAQKFAPQTVAALKKLQNTQIPPAVRASMDSNVRAMMTDPKLTSAQMMAQAKTLEPELRPAVYQSAAIRLATRGDLNGALDIVNANFTGEALDRTIDITNSSYASFLASSGRFDEAERIIDSLPDNMKVGSLISLAAMVFRKDPIENKTAALGILRKVRNMYPDRPNDQQELRALMQLTGAYAPIDAGEAFDVIEPVVPQLNELTDATAIVQAFNNRTSVRSGEFDLLNGLGSVGFQFSQPVLAALAKADYERTTKMIDSFSRREVRISLKLQLAETALK